MSVRTSAQKRDEKRTTLDEIKKIGYSMQVQKTAMDAVKFPWDVLKNDSEEMKEAKKRLKEANERVIKAGKRVTALEDEIGSLDPLDPKWVAHRDLQDELYAAVLEMKKAKLKLKSELGKEMKSTRVRLAGLTFEPKSEDEDEEVDGIFVFDDPMAGAEKDAEDPMARAEKDVKDAIARAEKDVKDARAEVEKAKAYLAKAKKEEDEARNTNKDLAEKVASVDGRRGLTAVKALKLKAMKKELEDSEEELFLAVFMREHAQEQLEEAQEEMESARETANGLLQDDRKRMITISRFLGKIRSSRLFQANRASKLYIFP